MVKLLKRKVDLVKRPKKIRIKIDIKSKKTIIEC
jgi:hypothetical protein